MTDLRAPGRNASARREKIGPLALTILLHIIVIALLFLQKGAPIPRKIEQSLTAIFLPEAKDDEGEQAKAKTEQKKAQESASAAPRPNPTPPVEPPETPDPPPPVPLGPSWLTMSSAEFAASDISKMARAQKGAGEDDRGDSTAAYGPGEGPGGARLYNADWFRKPTNAQLDGYLPANRPSKGWGLIACQTVERYHVDNCQTLGESPLGSGFGRAVREAAWQFLVLPPRINGKPQIGAWVRIRIDYGETDKPS